MAISAAALARMQALTSGTLDQSITIQRATPTSDGAGGSSLVWNTVATVAGHLGQPTPQLVQAYAHLLGAESSWLVRVPTGTNVLENDRLVVDGQTLRVQVLLAPRSYPVALRLLAAEVQ